MLMRVSSCSWERTDDGQREEAGVGTALLSISHFFLGFL